MLLCSPVCVCVCVCGPSYRMAQGVCTPSALHSMALGMSDTGVQGTGPSQSRGPCMRPFMGPARGAHIPAGSLQLQHSRTAKFLRNLLLVDWGNGVLEPVGSGLMISVVHDRRILRQGRGCGAVCGMGRGHASGHASPLPLCRPCAVAFAQRRPTDTSDGRAKRSPVDWRQQRTETCTRHCRADGGGRRGLRKISGGLSGRCAQAGPRPARYGAPRGLQLRRSAQWSWAVQRDHCPPPPPRARAPGGGAPRAPRIP